MSLMIASSGHLLMNYRDKEIREAYQINQFGSSEAGIIKILNPSFLTWFWSLINPLWSLFSASRPHQIYLIIRSALIAGRTLDVLTREVDFRYTGLWFDGYKQDNFRPGVFCNGNLGYGSLFVKSSLFRFGNANKLFSKPSLIRL